MVPAGDYRLGPEGEEQDAMLLGTNRRPRPAAIAR
jgi:hypothetical protein